MANEVKVLEIGTPIWFFDIESKEPVLKRDIVYGSFVNIESGDLYYYTADNKVPSYAIGEFEETVKQSLEAFLEYRKYIAELQAKADEARATLGGINLKEYLDDMCASLSESLSEQTEYETEGPANEQENV